MSDTTSTITVVAGLIHRMVSYWSASAGAMAPLR